MFYSWLALKTQTENQSEEEDRYCPNCEIQPSSSEFNITEEVLTLIFIPNIVVSDEPEQAIFSIHFRFQNDNYENVEIELIGFESTILNNKNEMIHFTDDMTVDSVHSFIKIWDGLVNGLAYKGEFAYSIRLDFVNNQFIDIQGIAIATTCEDFNKCAIDKDPEFNLENCRYHSFLLDIGHGTGTFCQ